MPKNEGITDKTVLDISYLLMVRGMIVWLGTLLFFFTVKNMIFIDNPSGVF